MNPAIKAQTRKGLEMYIKERGEYLVYASSNSEMSKLSLRSYPGLDTAAFNTQTKEVIVTPEFLETLSSKIEDSNLALLGLKAVIEHEARHSSMDQYWPITESSGEGMVLNHMADWKNNRIPARRENFLAGAKTVNQVLGTSRADRAPSNSSEHYIKWVYDMWEKALHEDTFSKSLKDSAEKISDSKAKKAALDSIPHMVEAYNCQPDHYFKTDLHKKSVQFVRKCYDVFKIMRTLNEDSEKGSQGEDQQQSKDQSKGEAKGDSGSETKDQAKEPKKKGKKGTGKENQGQEGTEGPPAKKNSDYNPSVGSIPFPAPGDKEMESTIKIILEEELDTLVIKPYLEGCIHKSDLDLNTYKKSITRSIDVAKKTLSNLGDRGQSSFRQKVHHSDMGEGLDVDSYLLQEANPNSSYPLFFDEERVKFRQGKTLDYEHLIFLVDISGSMKRGPIDISKEMLISVLEATRNSRVKVTIASANDNRCFWISSNKGNIEDSQKKVLGLVADGNIDMGASAMEYMFGRHQQKKLFTSPEKSRLIVFTDCDVSDRDRDTVIKNAKLMKIPTILACVNPYYFEKVDPVMKSRMGSLYQGVCMTSDKEQLLRNLYENVRNFGKIQNNSGHLTPKLSKELSKQR